MAAMCPTAPRGLPRWERMGVGARSGGRLRTLPHATQGAAVSDPIQPWPVNRNGDQGHPILTLQEETAQVLAEFAPEGIGQEEILTRRAPLCR